MNTIFVGDVNMAKENITFNVIERTKNDNADEIKQCVFNIVNNLMRKEFIKKMD